MLVSIHNPHGQKIVCMQFSFLSDHGGRKIASDLLTHPSARTENNINGLTGCISLASTQFNIDCCVSSGTVK